MTPKKVSFAYRILAFFVKLFTPRMKAYGTENITEEPVILVGNHCQMYGPIACEFYMPVPRYTWCAGQMMKLREVPQYAFTDFWSFKPWYSRWFFRLASYLIAPISVCIFNNANTIAVYRDTRIISTFKESLRVLQNGTNIVIFPEHNEPHNHVVYQFESNFIDIAKLYYKKTGKEIQFVPMYISPKLKGIYFGKPIRFCADSPIDEQRSSISRYLMEGITRIACDLPEHTIIPYRNIPKRFYPRNK